MVTIAFIDDHPSLRKAAEQLLKSDVHTVETFSSLDSYQNSTTVFDCVVCDWGVLGETPETTLQKLQLPNAIIISGDPVCSNSLSHTFLKKPFRFKTLIDTIQEKTKG